MNLTARIRRGDGAVWGTLKRVLLGLLCVHLPVHSPLKPLFRLLYGVHVGLREGLLWMLRFGWYEPLFRSQCTAVGGGFRMERLPYLTGHGRIVIGRRVRLSGTPSIRFSNRQHAEPELRIGDGTFVGHGCSIQVAESVSIGQHCLLASGVRISDFDGHPGDAGRRRAGEPTPAEGIRPIAIGDDVWIGAGALVLKGVAIGDRSIVGAGAVVTRDVPSDVVVAGNPARVVKEIAQAEIDS